LYVVIAGNKFSADRERTSSSTVACVYVLVVIVQLSSEDSVMVDGDSVMVDGDFVIVDGDSVMVGGDSVIVSGHSVMVGGHSVMVGEQSRIDR